MKTAQRRTKIKSDNPTIDYVKIEGGQPLNGEIVLRGAKNTVPKNMVAAILTDEHCELKDVPEIEDIEIITKIIELLGGEVTNDKETDVITIDAKNLKTPKAKDLVSYSGKSRIPVLFAGPLLARLSEAIIPAPGGCNIGSRPVDFHIAALEKLGATVEEHKDYVLTGVDIKELLQKLGLEE